MGVPVFYQGSLNNNKGGIINPIPLPPQFSGAEIGAVNAFTLVVTFDRNVSSSNYATGVTIKVNGTATSITSATRQANHAIVRYVIPVLWHGSGDVVTWEYASATGIIVSESGGAALGDVTAQSVTNNCEYVALLDLQADALTLNDGDPVSLWVDQSGQGNDFAQTGTARPIKQTAGGYPLVIFDGIDDYLIGQNFADNLSRFAVIICGSYTLGGGTILEVCKGTIIGTGWEAVADGSMYLNHDNSNYVGVFPAISPPENTDQVISYVEEEPFVLKVYVNGVNNDTHDDFGTPGSFSNSDPVTIGTNQNGKFSQVSPRGILIYQISNSTIWVLSDRAALETRLGARYGLTVP